MTNKKQPLVKEVFFLPWCVERPCHRGHEPLARATEKLSPTLHGRGVVDLPLECLVEEEQAGHRVHGEGGLDAEVALAGL